MNEEELKEIASQLSNPHGSVGLRVAEVMHKTNISMSIAAIDALRLKDQDAVLEIGHGNCGHLKDVLDKAAGLKYQGLEISELMHEEAIKHSTECGFENEIGFSLFDGKRIPFEDESFDKIMTVNTIYFWKRPLNFLIEIYRVLKPNGICVICYGEEAYMAELPFTVYGFNLYNEEKIKSLIALSPFNVDQTETKSEMVMSKIGGLAKRDYTTITLHK
jgi:ubiquinone/menaquinone biosynthesis C-methylase UbiE